MDNVKEAVRDYQGDFVSGEVFDGLIRRLNEVDVDVTGALNSTNPEAKEIFLGNPAMATPPNTHDRLKLPKIQKNLMEIKQIETEVAAGDFSAMERRILSMALRNVRQKNAFLLANANYLAAPTELNAELHRFANEQLYGRADRKLAFSLLADKMKLAERNAAERGLMDEYQEICNMLGEVEKPQVKRWRPKVRTVERFSAMAQEFFRPIFRHIPAGREFTPEEAAEIAEKILREMAPEGSAWKAVCDPEGTIANVSNFTIRFPGRRPLGNYSRKDLKKILVHELGTHAVRAIPFEKCRVAMFRSGLPGYEKFEEGLACVAEQAVDGEFREHRVEYYICTALVYFCHKNFRETYEIMRRLNHLTDTWNDSKTFDSVQRSLRGTDVLPNNRDFSYYYGNLLVWQYIEENLEDPELFQHLFVSGKTNYADPMHEKIAEAIRAGKL